MPLRSGLMGQTELRHNGVLGSSGSYRGALQRKEGDVILLLPALPHEGVKLFQEEVPQRSLLTMLGDERPKPREAEHLALGVVGLYQTVTVEQSRLVCLQGDLLLL